MGETRDKGGAIRGDGKRTEDEKEGNRHLAHARSPPTVQPWLRLWFEYLHVLSNLLTDGNNDESSSYIEGSAEFEPLCQD